MKCFFRLGSLVAEEITKDSCENLISNYHGEISFTPLPVHHRYSQECTWKFDPPASEEFIFVLDFTSLTSYDGDDKIFLPDGT